MWPFQRERPEPPLSYAQQLTRARAELARLEALDASDFTIYGYNGTVTIVRHGVDEKPVVIARQKAEIAHLEVMVAGLTAAEGSDAEASASR